LESVKTFTRSILVGGQPEPDLRFLIIGDLDLIIDRARKVVYATVHVRCLSARTISFGAVPWCSYKLAGRQPRHKHNSKKNRRYCYISAYCGC